MSAPDAPTTSPPRQTSPSPAPPASGPSRRGHWIGAATIVVALVVAGVWGVTGFLGLSGQIEDMQRVPMPGRAEVDLEQGGHVLYLDAPAEAGLPAGASGNVALLAEDGTAVPLDRYTNSLTYSLAGRTGEAVLTVDVTAVRRRRRPAPSAPSIPGGPGAVGAPTPR